MLSAWRPRIRNGVCEDAGIRESNVYLYRREQILETLKRDIVSDIRQ